MISIFKTKGFFHLFFAWYDAWIGFFIDKKKGVVYFCPFPMLVLSYDMKKYDDFEFVGSVFITIAVNFLVTAVYYRVFSFLLSKYSLLI